MRFSDFESESVVGSVGTFQSFRQRQNRYDGSYSDGKPNKAVSPGSSRSPGTTPGSYTLRILIRGISRSQFCVGRIQHNAVSHALRNYAHIVVHGNRHGPSRASHHKLLGTDYGNLRNGGVVCSRTNHHAADMHRKSF
jgi:hypothetical protein